MDRALFELTFTSLLTDTRIPEVSDSHGVPWLYVLYLSTDYPLYLLSALLCLAILQPTIIICAPLCLAILCTTDFPLYYATEITGHMFGP
jgi:hypothetical protein